MSLLQRKYFFIVAKVFANGTDQLVCTIKYYKKSIDNFAISIVMILFMLQYGVVYIFLSNCSWLCNHQTQCYNVTMMHCLPLLAFVTYGKGTNTPLALRRRVAGG